MVRSIASSSESVWCRAIPPTSTGRAVTAPARASFEQPPRREGSPRLGDVSPVRDVVPAARGVEAYIVRRVIAPGRFVDVIV